MQIYRLSVLDCDRIWDGIAEGVHRSCMKTGHTISAAWLRQQCLSGQATMFVAGEGDSLVGAVIVQLQELPCGITVRGLAMTGSRLREWVDPMREQIATWARAHGATQFIDTGRPGLKRFFKGADVVSVTYRIAL